LSHDSTYQYLANYYAAQHDYDGQVKLLELCFTVGQVDLEFYTMAEKTLTPTDWSKFEKRIIAHLQKAMQKAAAPSPWLSRVSPECKTLAEIYAYKNNLEPLCEIARTDMSLLVNYESKLLPHYPELYLDLYKRQIERLIAGRGRENYQAAAVYAETVKKIYQAFLNTPNVWNRYIDDLKSKNKRLRALREEFIAL
jgi:hypothetical protein